MIDIKAKIPDSFLEEETICDHLVTKQVKEVWAVEIDLLMELIRVCKKYQLRFIADYGTLLGTIRHKGFIPWDDDLDVSMPRKDYEKLCEVAAQEFESPYYLKHFGADRRYVSGIAKLMNIKTAAIENPTSDVAQGIFIDIFPVDNIVDDKRLLNKHLRKINFYRTLVGRAWYCSKENFELEKAPLAKKVIAKALRPVLSIMGFSPTGRGTKYLMKKVISTCTRYNDTPCTYATVLSSQGSFLTIHLVSDFNDILWKDFEFTQIPVERHFEEVLTRRYGDYHEFIKGASYHNILKFDTQRSYTEVIKEIRNNYVV
jgi:lipopolysaccharide cholinephosphotransferase